MPDPLIPGIREIEKHLELELHPEIVRMLEDGDVLAAVADTRYFFTEAEKVAANIDSPPDDCDVGAIQQLFAQLAREKVVEQPHDGDLLLIELTPFITPQEYPELWRLYFLVPGGKNYGLEKETHGLGYHVHYVDTSKNNVRTNAVFTFNPLETLGNKKQKTTDTLFWYQHAGKITVDPNAFGTKKKKNIHSICVGFLKKTKKHEFVTPPHKSQRFWPSK